MRVAEETARRVFAGENIRKIFARARIRVIDPAGDELGQNPIKFKPDHKGGMHMVSPIAVYMRKSGIAAVVRVDDYGTNWIEGDIGTSIREAPDVLINQMCQLKGGQIGFDRLDIYP